MQSSITLHRPLYVLSAVAGCVALIMLVAAVTWALATSALITRVAAQPAPVAAPVVHAVPAPANNGTVVQPATADDAHLSFESATHVEGVFPVVPHAADAADNPEGSSATTGRLLEAR